MFSVLGSNERHAHIGILQNPVVFNTWLLMDVFPFVLNSYACMRVYVASATGEGSCMSSYLGSFS